MRGREAPALCDSLCSQKLQCQVILLSWSLCPCSTLRQGYETTHHCCVLGNRLENLPGGGDQGRCWVKVARADLPFSGGILLLSLSASSQHFASFGTEPNSPMSLVGYLMLVTYSCSLGFPGSAGCLHYKKSLVLNSAYSRLDLGTFFVLWFGKKEAFE